MKNDQYIGLFRKQYKMRPHLHGRRIGLVCNISNGVTVNDFE